MRRSLTWYTRPIHLFQGAVIRAFQQITAGLQTHNEALRQTTESIADAEARVRALEQRVAAQAREIASLKNDLDTLLALRGETTK